MIKEQYIIKDIVESIGDTFNEYILELNCNSLWYYTERKIMVNNTFKKLINIMANHNSKEESDIINLAYEIDEELFMDVSIYMMKEYLEKGGKSLLQRLVLFCVSLHYHCRINKELPIEVLKRMYEEDVVSVKKNLKTKFLYKINKSDRPYEIYVDKFTITQFALLSGNTFEDQIKFYYDMEFDKTY